jgi:hypothetical protein
MKIIVITVKLPDERVRGKVTNLAKSCPFHYDDFMLGNSTPMR